MHRGVRVEVFGGEHAPAVVWGEFEWGAVGVPGAGGEGQRAQPASDGVGVQRAGMGAGLQQVGRAGQRTFFVFVAAVAGGDVVGAVEGADVADDLGDDPAELVPDRYDPGPVELGWFDVQQVVDLPVGQVSFEHVEGGQLAGFLDPQPAGEQ